MSKLGNLQKLYLGDNKLTALPSGISALRDLQEINISKNKELSKLPDMILMTRLRKLDLLETKISKPDIDLLLKLLPPTTEVKYSDQ